MHFSIQMHAAEDIAMVWNKIMNVYIHKDIKNGKLSAMNKTVKNVQTMKFRSSDN